MAIEFKDNESEVGHNGARVIIETLSVVDNSDNIYIFDMAGSNMNIVEKFIADGCPGDTVEEYGGTLL